MISEVDVKREKLRKLDALHAGLIKSEDFGQNEELQEEDRKVCFLAGDLRRELQTVISFQEQFRRQMEMRAVASEPKPEEPKEEKPAKAKGSKE